MSGEAAVSYSSEWYRFTYASGVNVSYAPEPMPDGTFVDRAGEHFAADEASLRARLSPRVPRITSVVEAYRRDGRLPLSPMGSPAISLQRAVIGTAGADSRRGYPQKLEKWLAQHDTALLVEASAPLSASLERVTVELALRAPLNKEVLDALLAELVNVQRSSGNGREAGRGEILVPVPAAARSMAWAHLTFCLPGPHCEAAARAALAERTRAQADFYAQLFDRVLGEAASAGKLGIVPVRPDVKPPLTVEREFTDGRAVLQLAPGPGARVAAVHDEARNLLHRALANLNDARYGGLP